MIGVGPTGFFHWDETDRYVKLVATELSVNINDDERWSFGPVINYRFGRSDVEDAIVKLMSDIDNTIEGGFFIGVTEVDKNDVRHRYSISGQVTTDLGSVHDGVLATLSARYWVPVAKPLVLSIGGSVTYASDDFNDTYFGVSVSDASQSGLTAFEASGGIRDFKISPMAIFSFNQNWHLGAGVVYQRLLSDAADSPVVKNRGNENQLYAGVGLIYAW